MFIPYHIEIVYGTSSHFSLYIRESCKDLSFNFKSLQVGVVIQINELYLGQYKYDSFIISVIQIQSIFLNLNMTHLCRHDSFRYDYSFD